MKKKTRRQAALESYFRAAGVAAASVIATGNWSVDDILKAAMIAVLPPLLRYADVNDTAFGRGARGK